MASGYHLTVKKYLDQNRIEYPLPDYIQRGWNRIYTPEEKEFIQRSCIIGPDVQIPNSVVRYRLGTNQMSRKTNMEILRKALELPEELFKKLSGEHQRPEMTEDENLHFQWDDDDDDLERKRQKSPLSALIDKQREKRRKYEDYKYDYDNLEPLTMDEIIEEIRTNIGKDLKTEDIKLITELMQIISRNKTDQIMNIFDELTNIQLIDKFGGVPKLVQALQEIQKAFEQVAMKTNVASIETVIDVLLEKDNTYRVAAELLNAFNENVKKNKPVNLNDRSGDISDHDHTVFNILIRDRISRLPVTDLKVLIHDLESIRTVDTSKLNDNRDDQVKFLSEQLNIIFTRAHLDGIKTTLNAMKSPVSVSLREFIDKIEKSLTTKLTEHDHMIVESYIQDYLTSLNDNELKIVHERLAQQGTLKRSIGFNELNQSITMGLMKTIDTDGLESVIENMKQAHLDIHAMNELAQALTHINQHIQTPTSISLEQIQNQLEMAYFVETHNLTEQKIHQLAEAVELYSIAHISLSEEATKDECSTYLEHLKGPFVRQCIQRIFNSIDQENSLDSNKVSNRFYNERIVDLINELIGGSDELNKNLLFHKIKKQLKKSKDLPDKLYRQMLKGKSIQIDAKMTIDTDKKKMALINDGINRIFNDKKEQNKQKELMELFNRIDIPIPERVKNWYRNKPNISNQKSVLTKVKQSKMKNLIKTSVSKTKSITPTTKAKDRLPTTTVVSSSKRDNERKRSLPKTQPTVPPVMRRRSKILNTTKKMGQTSVEKEKTKIKPQISITSKLKDRRKNTSDISIDDQTVSTSTTTKTEAFDVDTVLKPQIEREDIRSEDVDSPLIKQEQIQEKDDEQSSVHQSANTSPDAATTTTQIEKDFDASPDWQKIEIFQADLETIRSETTIDGKMGENKTINFELNQAAACYLYQIPLPGDPRQDINIQLSGKIAEFTDDLPYVKTKAQRVLAKAISTSTSQPYLGGDTNDTRSSSTKVPTNDSQSTSTSIEPRKSIGSSTQPVDDSSAKAPSRTLNKSLKQTDNYYINSLTKLLQNLFTRPEYNSLKLRKIHDELIASGHISPLNEFYRSTNDALRVTLDHCATYNELIAWTLSLLQTNNKPDLIDFGHDLYSIAIELDLALTDRIDNTRCAMEIQENLKHQLQTISENDLREINSYINAAQSEKIINMSKKLNVTSKDRMISDLNTLLLHLIQNCHTFESKYRPMQTRIREISETFKSRAVADLARKIDEIEKHLSKTFNITLFSASQRMNESRFQLIK